MKARHKRFTLIAVGFFAVAIAVSLVLVALDSNINLFLSPTKVVNKEDLPKDAAFRLGGIVEEGSVQRQADGLTVHFFVTDRVNKVKVKYKGILPDLFQEGQSVVTLGRLKGDMFEASEVLAKHDEEYMPREVEEAIAQAKKTQSEQSANTAPQL